MRVIIIGNPDERRRFRDALEHSPFEIVAEFAARDDAREAELRADAVLEAADSSRADLKFTDGAQAGLKAGLYQDDDFEGPGPEHLTSRELEVLELIAEGLPNKAIAARLGISDQTVKFHASQIQGKLGAANRTDAVRRAVRRGLVTL
jgi:two-component system nitrate/nitrite response regulator NarL